MTGMKKALTGIFVNFPSESCECPLFAFSEEQKPCKKGPWKKGWKNALHCFFQYLYNFRSQLKDHLNIPALCGLSPLVGRNEPEWGPRFPNMHNCYDQDLRKIGHEGKLDRSLNY